MKLETSLRIGFSLARYLKRNASFIVQGRSYLSTFMPRRWLKDKSGRRCSVTERDERSPPRSTLAGIRETCYFHFQRAAIQGLHATSYGHTWCARPSRSSFAMSHLATLTGAKKKERKRDKISTGTTGVTCARFAVRLAERRGMEEGSRV